MWTLGLGKLAVFLLINTLIPPKSDIHLTYSKGRKTDLAF